jgi:thioredoxin-like negative regulator of GroEL
MQKNALKLLSIFTLVFFVMSMTGAAATSTKTSTASSTKGQIVVATQLNQINSALASKPVFVRFGSSHCGHCKKFQPTFEALAKEYNGKATFISIDIGNSPALAAKFNARGVPDISVITSVKNGKYIYMKMDGKTTITRSQARLVGDQHKTAYQKLLKFAIKK